MPAGRSITRAGCEYEILESRRLLSAAGSTGFLADGAAGPFSYVMSRSESGEVSFSWAGDFSAKAQVQIEQQNADGSYHQIRELAADSGGAFIDGLPVGESFTFRLRADDHGVESAYSDPLTITIVNNDPQNVKAVAVSPHEIDLSWIDPSAPPGTVYYIFRGGSKNFDPFGTNLIAQQLTGTMYSDGPSADFLDQGLEPGTTYYYQVAAIPPDGELSPTSAEASATTFARTITVDGVPVFAVPGRPFIGTVASFSDAKPHTSLAGYTATIIWADGSTSAGLVVGGHGGTAAVQVSHTFGGSDAKFIVRITRPGGGMAEAVGNVAQFGSAAGLSYFPLRVFPRQQSRFTEVLGTFTDGLAPGAAADYSAVIDWADGTTSPGAVTGADGVFQVTGSHDYLHSGDLMAGVAITRVGTTGEVVSFAQPIDVLATASVAGLYPFTAVAGRPFYEQVAGFFDATVIGSAEDYSATILWADGTTSAGTVIPDATWGTDLETGFAVYLSGTATVSQNFSLQIVGPTGFSFSGEAILGGSVKVGPARGLTVFPSFPDYFTTGDSYGGVIADFTDGDRPGKPGDYVAVVDWGDGSTAVGDITLTPDGVFHVDSSHVYVADGTYNATVSVVRTADVLPASPFVVLAPPKLPVPGSVAPSISEVPAAAAAAATSGRAAAGRSATLLLVEVPWTVSGGNAPPPDADAPDGNGTASNGSMDLVPPNSDDPESSRGIRGDPAPAGLDLPGGDVNRDTRAPRVRGTSKSIEVELPNSFASFARGMPASQLASASQHAQFAFRSMSGTFSVLAIVDEETPAAALTLDHPGAAAIMVSLGAVWSARATRASAASRRWRFPVP